MGIPLRLGLRMILVIVLLAGTLCATAASRSGPPARVDSLEATLAGEFALQGGQLPLAARNYLEAARAAQDPVLAERAMRIALLADEEGIAQQAWSVWRALAPQSGRDQHMLAASLALRIGKTRDARRELQALYASGDWQMSLAALAGAVGKQPKLVVKLLAEAVDSGVLPNELAAWLGYGGLAERLDQKPLVDSIIR